MDPRGLSRSNIRFNIANRGSRRIADPRNRRRYRELLRDTPQWNAELKVEQDNDADWIIVAAPRATTKRELPEVESTR